MKTKDLLYIGAIGLLGYLLWKKNYVGAKGSEAQLNMLDQPKSMDLPNLTPSTGLATETALTQGLGEITADCGNEFTIVEKDVTKRYVNEGGKFMLYSSSALSRIAPIEITLADFKKACDSYKLTTSTPILKGNPIVEAVSNFSGTLYRGIM